MKIVIDMDAKTLAMNANDEVVTRDLFSKEAFDVVADLWTRLGWVRKYSYGFSWMGRPIIQLPEDMIRIQEAIWQLQPDVIIETGIAHGGSLIFYASLMALIGKGRVIGIDLDIRQHNRVAIEAHPMAKHITMIEGSSIAHSTVEKVKALINPGEKVMLILDSNHERDHVSAELAAYADLVSPGSYILSQDGVMRDLAGLPRTKADWNVNNPISAVEKFLDMRPDFELIKPSRPFDETFGTPDCSYHPVGWLRRKNEAVAKRDHVTACPVCGSDALFRSVRRSSLPIFQNVVYDTREEALACPRGSLTIGTCESCGFSFNTDFEPEKIVYDTRYDNHVASDSFDAYYRQLARELIDRYSLDQGTVYDVGCGNGAFLRILCELAPNIRGVGIDPSCKPLKEGRLELIAAPFSPELFDATAQLVVCRHVLEHMHQPVEFLSQLHKAMPNTPLYVEVPDLDWIIDNNAFWDFCYEHCNYFTMETLALAMSKAGFTVDKQQNAFGGQYQWASATSASGRSGDTMRDERMTSWHAHALDEVARLQSYLSREEGQVDAVCKMADAEGGIVLWGMATKGVILSSLIGTERVICGIDMNKNKQARFVPGSGIQVDGPDQLVKVRPGSQVVAMNPNYRDEIAAIIAGTGANVRLTTLRAEPLAVSRVDLVSSRS